MLDPIKFEQMLVQGNGRATDWFQRWLVKLRTAVNSGGGSGGGVTVGALGTEPASPSEGTLFFVTGFNHLVIWDGSAWQFTDDPSGRFGDFAVAPGNGWILCDGTVTSYLTVGATLGSTAFTTPNQTAGTYHKSGTYDGVINAAVAPTISGNTAQDLVNFGTVAAGAAGDVSLKTHVHDMSTGVITSTAQPKNMIVLRYFRR